MQPGAIADCARPGVGRCLGRRGPAQIKRDRDILLLLVVGRNRAVCHLRDEVGNPGEVEHRAVGRGVNPRLDFQFDIGQLAGVDKAGGAIDGDDPPARPRRERAIADPLEPSIEERGPRRHRLGEVRIGVVVAPGETLGRDEGRGVAVREVAADIGVTLARDGFSGLISVIGLDVDRDHLGQRCAVPRRLRRMEQGQVLDINLAGRIAPAHVPDFPGEAAQRDVAVVDLDHVRRRAVVDQDALIVNIAFRVRSHVGEGYCAVYGDIAQHALGHRRAVVGQPAAVPRADAVGLGPGDAALTLERDPRAARRADQRHIALDQDMAARKVVWGSAREGRLPALMCGHEPDLWDAVGGGIVNCRLDRGLVVVAGNAGRAECRN